MHTGPWLDGLTCSSGALPPHCSAVPPSSPPPRAMPACAAALSDPSTDRMLLVCRSIAVWKTSGTTADPAHHSPPPLTIVEAAQVHSTHSPSSLTSGADRSCRRLLRSLKVAQQVRVGKEPRKPSLSSGNRCRTVHSCDDVLTHEHCGGAATMLKSSDTKQLSRASRAVTPESCSDVEASHHQPARAHGSSAGRKAHFGRRGRAAGAERSWKAAPHGEGDMPYCRVTTNVTRL